MKALFLIFHGFAAHNGISKKIFYQRDALQSCIPDTSLCYLTVTPEGHRQRKIDDILLKDYGTGWKAKIAKRIEYKSLYEYICQQQIQLVYIRYDHNANPFFNRFLRKLQTRGITTVIEIPTFPYDQEYADLSFKDRLNLYADRCFRKAMAKRIYRFVTFSEDTSIFGTPTIRISNGIDFSRIPLKSGVSRQTNELRLIGVADIRFWHGFDRVIAGLKNYYQTPHKVQVHFDIVGGGIPEELRKLRDMTEKNKLTPYVTFHGPRAGQELDDLFNQADLGIASLGRHRCGITHIKTLKTREYAARGIPFVYSESDEDFDTMPYVLKAPADDSPLEIEKVVEFYQHCGLSPQTIRGSIEKQLSWKVQMEKVIRELSFPNRTEI